MNIFVLDDDPAIAAQMMCDKHIPKMIVETFQMLGSALRRHGATDEQMPLTSKGTPLLVDTSIILLRYGQARLRQTLYGCACMVVHCVKSISSAMARLTVVMTV